MVSNNWYYLSSPHTSSLSSKQYRYIHAWQSEHFANGGEEKDDMAVCAVVESFEGRGGKEKTYVHEFMISTHDFPPDLASKLPSYSHISAHPIFSLIYASEWDRDPLRWVFERLNQAWRKGFSVASGCFQPDTVGWRRMFLVLNN